ncbi:MAG: PilZ domain-containing protein [Candidatus Omnitrophica bacterium]|nr:PilZ domain-containing protein [Candidatus Omnitrophota bacterium]
MSESFKNHRQHVRIYRNFILTYHLVTNPSAHQEVSQINNISRGGVSFSVTAPLKVGEQMGIDLRTPFLSEGIYLQGEVLECREKIAGLIYEIRLQFKEPSTLAREILVKIEQYSVKEE